MKPLEMPTGGGFLSISAVMVKTVKPRQYFNTTVLEHTCIIGPERENELLLAAAAAA